jgi:hypothetical protein
MNGKHNPIKYVLTLFFMLIILFLAGCSTAPVKPDETEESAVVEEQQSEPITEPTNEPTVEPTIEPNKISPPKDPNFPPALIYHSGLYESNDNQILIFGGNSKHGINADVKEVFIFDPSSGLWGEPTPYEANPPWKNAMAPAYDEESDRVIILNMAGETWAYEYGSTIWELMEPSNAPAGRCGHSMSYDSQSDVVVLYGGFACNSPMDPMMDEVWAYDYNSNSWTAMLPGPSARIYHTTVYDSESDRILMWGGRPYTESADSNIYAYDFNTDSWAELIAEGGPSDRSTYHSMAYVPELDRTFIIGGVVLDGFFGGDFVLDVWEYDFNNNAWSLIETTGDSLPSLAKQVLVYDPGTGLMYMFGGSRDVIYDDANISYEFWSFDPVNHSWDNLLIED